jgi:D-sedoheptulose 7-phosphate isomerase
MTTSSVYAWTVSKKIPLDDFLCVLDSYHSAGKTIVTTNGCFDLLHVGHTRFLEQARSLGDVLIVGLNSDASVRRIKGGNRPVLPEAERAAMLLALKSVDHVLIFDDQLPINFLAAIKPAIHCKAGDYASDGLPEADVVRSNGGEICILPVVSGYSTSKVIERILASEKDNGIPEEENSHLSSQLNEVLDFFFAGSNILRQTGYRLAEEIIVAVDLLTDALQSGHKILICGNGGSAADAQHFAAELVVKYKLARQALPAMSLTTDSSILTASGNDYGFDQIFSRQVQAYGRPGDVLVAISTSGSSPNILAAIQEAKSQGIKVLGLTGLKKSPMQGMADICLSMPSEDVPLIQQAHTAIIHVLCDQIEKGLPSR